jgi:hypothetical protein
MGLTQKRIVQEFQEGKYAAWKKELNTLAGFDVPMDVKWETMMSDEYDQKDLYFKWYERIYFRPLMTIFKNLCADQMGKDAVKAGIKKIEIFGNEGTNFKASSFEGGVLVLKHKFHSNESEENDRAKGWQKMIEAKL